MDYISVAEAAKRWALSERSVRNYCAQGRIPGALLTGKTWNIPETAEKPARKPRRDAGKRDLLTVLREEKAAKLHGGIYHKIQIDLTYNSNHIEGSRLTHDQTRLIYETNTIGMDASVRVDDVVETANHFRCIDLIIDAANHAITESLIKQLHAVLKNGTTDSRKVWFAVGDYKRFPNEVGGRATTAPKDVPAAMKRLLRDYNAKKGKPSTICWTSTTASSVSTPSRTATAASAACCCSRSVCASAWSPSSSRTTSRPSTTAASRTGKPNEATSATPASWPRIASSRCWSIFTC